MAGRVAKTTHVRCCTRLDMIKIRQNRLSKMYNPRKIYRQFLNVAICFVGVCFAVVGVMFIIFFTSGSALFAVPGLVVAALGVLLACKRPWGWGLFCSCGFFCAITSFPVFVFCVECGPGNAWFWILSIIFCGLPYLLASVGFIQAVSAVSCTQLPSTWATLRVSQRLVIVAFAGSAAWLLTLCTYFLASLTATPNINSGSL